MPCEPFPRGPIKPAETVLKSKPLRRRGIAGPSALIRLASGPMRLTRISRLMSVEGVGRAKAALSSGCKPHPAIAPAGSNRSSHGGNEVAEAYD
jgi:hypothetical protein